MKQPKHFRKKVDLSTQEPRQLQEINVDYQQLCANAGQCQYQITQFKKQLDVFNARLEEVNNEAAARQKLDKETVSAEVTETKEA